MIADRLRFSRTSLASIRLNGVAIVCLLSSYLSYLFIERLDEKYERLTHYQGEVLPSETVYSCKQERKLIAPYRSPRRRIVCFVRDRIQKDDLIRSGQCRGRWVCQSMEESGGKPTVRVARMDSVHS